MTLNKKDNVINEISNLNDEEINKIELAVYLVSKAVTTDGLYNAKREYLDPSLMEWVKKNIKKELNKLKFEGENKDKKFYITPYDNELTKTDFIAELNLFNDKELEFKKDKLLESLLQDTYLEDSEVKFQIIRIEYNKKNAYFIYYRGVKQAAIAKKRVGRIPSIRHREQLIIQENDVVEFGGKIELIIVDNCFYVVSPRTLEYSFDYTDHISARKEENLKAITAMNFFNDDPNVDVFIEKSSQYMISRRLASIEPETLEILERSFVDRCNELKKIKEKIPEDPAKRETYIAKYEVLWPLYDHIDILDKKIKINPEKSIEPLIYFFADKIVESFLTKELKEAP